MFVEEPAVQLAVLAELSFCLTDYSCLCHRWPVTDGIVTLRCHLVRNCREPSKVTSSSGQLMMLHNHLLHYTQSTYFNAGYRCRGQLSPISHVSQTAVGCGRASYVCGQIVTPGSLWNMLRNDLSNKRSINVTARSEWTSLARSTAATFGLWVELCWGCETVSFRPRPIRGAIKLCGHV